MKQAGWFNAETGNAENNINLKSLKKGKNDCKLSKTPMFYCKNCNIWLVSLVTIYLQNHKQDSFWNNINNNNCIFAVIKSIRLVYSSLDGYTNFNQMRPTCEGGFKTKFSERNVTPLFTINIPIRVIIYFEILATGFYDVIVYWTPSERA